MKDILGKILEQEQVKSLLSKSEEIYIVSQIDSSYVTKGSPDERMRLLYLLISVIFSESYKYQELEGVSDKAYILLKSINVKDEAHLMSFKKYIDIQDIDSIILYYFILASVALRSDKVVNIRIDLTDFDKKVIDYQDWKRSVINATLSAFLLLVRKSSGFSDVSTALEIIAELQTKQNQFEQSYLKNLSAENEVEDAFELLAFYHVSKAVVETAKYLVEGYNYKERIENVVRVHIDVSKRLLKSKQTLLNVCVMLEANLKDIFENSIWTKTAFNDKIRQLCIQKSQLGYLDLLPSQREALNKNLLDVASNVTIVQMPTSAGKTLLAEFNILVTKALRQDSKIVYIVPSRALVNQVYHDLKNDLEPLDLVIEKTSSAIEVDPGENAFLEDNIDILVSTPEKLDLLIRRQHASVLDVSLFIVDEAHTIQNGERGARLELLLTLLKRERPNSKFMLLSPFIGKAATTIKDWLGGGHSISIDWKPAEKIIIGLDVGEKKGEDVFKHEFLPSGFKSFLAGTKHSTLSSYSLKKFTKKDKLFMYTAKHFSKDEKTVLFLCKGKRTADKRAKFIFDEIGDEFIHSDEVNLVSKYIRDEVGMDTVLSTVLSKGVTVHHAGLSDETKLLIEHLIRIKKIKFVCSTTTIAEGVNFPVSTVFFDSLWKGDDTIKPSDFWNISGRAGRTLVDNFGRIILPFNSSENREGAKKLLEESSQQLVSVLSELFINSDKILQRMKRENFSISNLIADYYRSLSPLVQYFIHLIRTSNQNEYSTQIEDLFKDSLEYYMLDSVDKKEKFIQICKEIYLHIQKKYNDPGILSFADKTGFSVPSILSVMHEKKRNGSVSDLSGWAPDAVFNASNISNLTEKVRVISSLRETQMGTDSQQAPFEPEHIARILVGWVKGAKYADLSLIHPTYEAEIDSSKRITEFINKMNDIRFKASWGLSALEGIVKGNSEDFKDSFIPSLVYYGVDDEKALMLRMVGVPRSISKTMANFFDKSPELYRLSDVRKKIKDFSSRDWDDISPNTSVLSGQEWKRIAQILIA